MRINPYTFGTETVWGGGGHFIGVSEARLLYVCTRVGSINEFMEAFILRLDHITSANTLA